MVEEQWIIGSGTRTAGEEDAAVNLVSTIYWTGLTWDFLLTVYNCHLKHPLRRRKSISCKNLSSS